jgi:branched-chain amino acid transport system permease protein
MISENHTDLKAVLRMQKGKVIRYTISIVIGATLLLAPFIVGSYAQHWISQVLIYSIFALSLNLLTGYAGLFSLGHAAFFGIGAYTTGILMTRYGITSFWLLAPAGVFLATVCAFIFGIIALRTSGVYFLFVTMALGELLAAAAIKWVPMTGGSNGIVGIYYPTISSSMTMNAISFYYLVLVVFVLCIFLMYRFIQSPFGLALQGIRDDELRMRQLGYHTWLHKYITYGIAGLFAGLAGVLFAPASGAVVPEVLGTLTSAIAMLMVVIGSTQAFSGPIIGAIVILFLQYYASIFTPMRWPLILGGVFVISVMFLRGGIGIYLIALWNRTKEKPWKY